MEIKKSSAYVIEQAKRLNVFFKSRGWIVTAGKNNCILIYIPSQSPHNFTSDQLAKMIVDGRNSIGHSGLRLTNAIYYFYYKGQLFDAIEIIPDKEFDTDIE